MLDTKSKAFRRGFVAGFRSPYAVFSFERPQYSIAPIDHVALSWLRVGNSISSALKIEEQANGKRTEGAIKVRPSD